MHRHGGFRLCNCPEREARKAQGSAINWGAVAAVGAAFVWGGERARQESRANVHGFGSETDKWNPALAIALGAGLAAPHIRDAAKWVWEELQRDPVPQPEVVPAVSAGGGIRIPPPRPLASLPALIPPAGSDESEAPPVWTPPVDSAWLAIASHPSVILIIGGRGAGKSALGYRLLELNRSRAAPYVVGAPRAARKQPPDWIGHSDCLEEVPDGSVVLVDEAYLQLHARGSMSQMGRKIGELVNLSRQKRQTLIFVTQEARQLDVNVVAQADVIAIKKLGEIGREFERKGIRRFTDPAHLAFASVRGDSRRWTWVYSQSQGEVGLVENETASFWTPAHSRAYANAGANTARAGLRRVGSKTPRRELKARVKRMRAAGATMGQIERACGISKSHVHTLVHEPDDPERGPLIAPPP